MKIIEFINERFLPNRFRRPWTQVHRLTKIGSFFLFRNSSSIKLSKLNILYKLFLFAYLIISMNTVMYSSKDWPFNQILAYLWSSLSISAFVQIIFCNFAVKQQKSIMAKLNRIRVVLAERDLNNKWLSDKLGKDPATVSKWVTNTTQPSLEALIAIANALEVPVQELVRQEEMKQNSLISKN